MAFLPLTTGEHAWLHGVAQGLMLLESQQQAISRDPGFDLGTALQRQLSQAPSAGGSHEQLAAAAIFSLYPLIHTEVTHVHRD